MGGVCSTIGDRRGVYSVLVGGGKRKGKKDQFENLGVDGRIILRWIFRKLDMGAWTGSSWFRIGIGGGHL